MRVTAPTLAPAYTSIDTRTASPRCRSEEHTSELQSHHDLVCRLLLEKKKKTNNRNLLIAGSLFAHFFLLTLYMQQVLHFSVFFFNDTATTEIYTLSLHDALPIYRFAEVIPPSGTRPCRSCRFASRPSPRRTDRSEEHTSELQSHHDLVCRLLLEKKKKKKTKKKMKKKKKKKKKTE